MTRAEELLLHIYKMQGPRDQRGKIIPVGRYAAMTLAKVNTVWDFDGRVLMHEIATALVKKPRKRR